MGNQSLAIRPWFFSVEQAQEFLATRYEEVTPWLCAQRARAFIFLANRYHTRGNATLFKSHWKSARAFVCLGKRIRSHGPRGNVHFPSDWLQSDGFLFPGRYSKLDVTRLKEDFFEVLQVASPRQALEALDEIEARAARLRVGLAEKVAETEAREREEWQNRQQKEAA